MHSHPYCAMLQTVLLKECVMTQHNEDLFHSAVSGRIITADQDFVAGVIRFRISIQDEDVADLLFENGWRFPNCDERRAFLANIPGWLKTRDPANPLDEIVAYDYEFGTKEPEPVTILTRRTNSFRVTEEHARPHWPRTTGFLAVEISENEK